MNVASPPHLSQPNLVQSNSSQLTNLRPNLAANSEAAPIDPALVQAAESMEAMFIDYMMQVMRQSVPRNDMDLESPASQIYKGMLDSEYAKKAAHTGGVGLADLIIAYMESRRYNLSEGQGMSSKAVGYESGQASRREKV